MAVRYEDPEHQHRLKALTIFVSAVVAFWLVCSILKAYTGGSLQ